MTSPATIDPVVASALAGAVDFVGQVTGTEPTPVELADALKRYFVLNEIKEHILMLRSGATDILK